MTDPNDPLKAFFSSEEPISKFLQDEQPKKQPQTDSIEDFFNSQEPVSSFIKKPNQPSEEDNYMFTSTGYKKEDDLNLIDKAIIGVNDFFRDAFSPIKTEQKEESISKTENITRSIEKTGRTAIAESSSSIGELIRTYLTAPGGIPYSWNPASEKGKDRTAKKLIKRWNNEDVSSQILNYAEEQKDKASEIDTDPDHWTGIAGSVVPYTAGTVLAVATAPVSAPLSASIGTANIAFLGLSSFGAGIEAYDTYKESKGLDIDQNERLGAGLLYGASEILMERLQLNKFMPKGAQSKIGRMIFGAIPEEQMTKKGLDLVQAFAKSGSGRKELLEQVSKSMAEGFLYEGSTEALTELTQEFSNWLYYESEDRDINSDFFKRIATSFAGGAMMGGTLGPLSYGSQQTSNKKRREESGKVVLATGPSGEALEIVSSKKPNDKGEVMYQAMRPNGKFLEVSENDLSNVMELPYDSFKAILSGKASGEAINGEALNEQIADQARQQRTEAEQAISGKTLIDDLGNELVIEATMEGQEVFVIGIDPENSNMYYIVDKEGEKRAIDSERLENLYSQPVQDWIDQRAPSLENTPIPYDTSRPVQAGEQITLPEGATEFPGAYVVTGIDKDAGIVLAESIEEEGYIEEIPIETFNKLREEIEDITPDEITQDAAALRDMFGQEDTGQNLSKKKISDSDNFQPGDQVDFEISKQPELTVKEIKVGKRTVKIQEESNGDRQVITKDKMTQKQAKSPATSINNQYPRVKFEVVDQTPIDDDFAEQDFILVQRKSKSLPDAEYTYKGEQVDKPIIEQLLEQGVSDEITIKGDSKLNNRLVDQKRSVSAPEASQVLKADRAEQETKLADLVDRFNQGNQGIKPDIDLLTESLKYNLSTTRSGELQVVDRKSGQLIPAFSKKKTEITEQEVEQPSQPDPEVNQKVTDFIQAAKSAREANPDYNPFSGIQGVSVRKNQVDKFIEELESDNPSERSKSLRKALEGFAKDGFIPVKHSANAGRMFINETENIPFDEFLKSEKVLSEAPTVEQVAEIDRAIEEFTDDQGEVDYSAIQNQINQDEGYFNTFPFSLNKTELEQLKSIVNEKSGPAKQTGQISEPGNQPRTNQNQQIDENTRSQEKSTQEPERPGEGSKGTKQKLKAKEEALKNELSDLWSKFGQSGTANTGVSPEQFKIAGDIIAKGSELGLVKFKQFVEWLRDNAGMDSLRQNFDAFKAAYTANRVINNPESEDFNEIAKSQVSDFVQKEDETTKSPDVESKSLVQNEEIVKEDIKPWTLSKEGFSQLVYQGKYELYGLGMSKKSVKGLVKSYNATEDPWNKSQVKKEIDTIIDRGHTVSIYKAFKSGEDIPENVLKDYPQVKRAVERKRMQSFESEPKKTDNLETPNLKQDVPDRSESSQQDSEGITNDLSIDEGLVSGNGNGGSEAGKQDDPVSTKGSGATSRKSSSKRTTPSGGRQVNLSLFDQVETTKSTEPVTGIVDGRGDIIDVATGTKADSESNPGDEVSFTEAVGSFAEKQKLNRELQKKAENITAKLMDENNIRETLPFLLPEQQDDVIKAEYRFFSEEHRTKEKAQGKGFLFTNGTGTGKTYTGLGIIKRFAKQGKKDVLIVVPSQPKVSDWAEAGVNLDLSITALQGTKDQGSEINVTTYANFRANTELHKRDFDLIIYDESHRLMEDKKGRPSSTTHSHYELGNVNQWNAENRIKSSHPLWIKEKGLRDELKKLKNQFNASKKLGVILPSVQLKIDATEELIQELKPQQAKALPKIKERATKAVEKTHVVFLSATPFKQQFNLRYANGFLFDWSGETTYEGSSRVDPESRFFLDNFGSKYEWKYHRLQEKSDANADAIAMQEMAFANKLMESGVMSGRAIESNRDYSREFPLVTGFDTETFNSGFNDIFNYEAEEFNHLRGSAIDVFFNYNYTTKLLESMRASLYIPRIEAHMKLGRKAVVFHRRKQAGVNPPFREILNLSKIEAENILTQKRSEVSDEKWEAAEETLVQIKDFESKHAGLLKYEQNLNYNSAIDQFREAFGDKLRLINGDVSPRDKNKAIKDFNQDGAGAEVILVQEESGKEGISLHDVTGNHQRVLASLSMPISSITALQVEGRTYRIGNESDAIFEYPVIGLDMEIAHFGMNLNKKLSTTENLAMGENARDLLKSFSQGVANANPDEPSLEQGKGGKDLDKRLTEETSRFRKAILYYDSNQKNRRTRNNREGVDFYATPEPVGQKMVEWLGLEATQSMLEPSAGKGAIAMWAPSSIGLTAIEPSFDLYSKLSAAAGGGTRKIVNQRFEDFNIINKFDGVAMNPPFGKGGSLAMEHVFKGLKHLRNGGRLIAIVPTSSQVDKKLNTFFEEKDSSNIYLRASLKLPSVTFKQAGTAVNTKILVFDRVDNAEKEGIDIPPMQEMDLSYNESTQELFEDMEFMDMPEKITVEQEPELNPEVQPVKLEEGLREGFLIYELKKHTKTDADLHTVSMAEKIDYEEYKKIAAVAKSMGGFYSKYTRSFHFKTKDEAQKFIDSSKESNPDVKHYKWPTMNDASASKAKVQATVDNIIKQWPNAPEVEVFSYADQIKEAYPQLNDINLRDSPGIFYDNKVILNANHSAHDRQGETEMTILHEVIGHYGVGQFLKQNSGEDFEKQFKSLMSNVFAQKWGTAQMADIASKYFDKSVSELTTEEMIEAAEEYIAHTAQTGIKDSFVDRLVSMLRRALRKIGLQLKITDAEIRNLIGNAYRYVTQPNGQTGLKSELRFQISKNPDIGYLKNPDPINRQNLDDSPRAQTIRLRLMFDSNNERWIKGIERYQDHMVRGKKLIEEKIGRKVKDSSNFYVKENLAKGRILEQTEKFMRQRYKPLIQTGKAMSKAHGLTMEEIGDYLYALHAPERNAYISENNPKAPENPSGMSNEEANGIVEAFESKVPEELRTKLRNQVQDINSFVNQKRLSSGLISQEVYDQLQEQYENYVPLRGWEDLQNEDSTVYSPLISAKGRKSKAASPIPYLVTAAQEAIMKGENNLVRQSLFEFMKENPNKSQYQIRNAWYRKTGEQDDNGVDVWEETITRPTKEEINSGNAYRAFNPMIHRSVKSSRPGENTVSVMVKGKKIMMEFVRPELAMAIKNTSQEKVPKLLTKLRAYTRWLSSMYTQYSPEFGLRNLIRDFGFGSFNAINESGFKSWAQMSKEVPKSMRDLSYFFYKGDFKNDQIKEFIEAGGLTGYSDLKQAKDIFSEAQTEIERLDRKGLWNTSKALTKGSINAVLKPIDIYNRTLENAVRFSYFKALRRDGQTAQQAAIKAKDLTVNFNRKGNSSSVIGTIFMFFNASVQGNERLFRNFFTKETAKKATVMMGSIIAAGFAQGMLFGLMDDDDEDGDKLYSKVPDYVKRTHIVIPNFINPGPGKYLKIPLPYGVNVFYSMGEQLASVILGQQKPTTAATGLMTAASDSFSPVGGFDFEGDELSIWQKLLHFSSPSVMAPVADLAFNRTFTGAPIAKEPFMAGQPEGPDSQQYFPGVNPIYKRATDFLNESTGGDEVIPGAVDINPEWIEHGMRSYFGGPMQFIENTSQTISTAIQGESVWSDPAYRKFPFVRNYVQKAGSDFQARQEYYEKYNDLSQLDFEFKEYLKNGQEQKARSHQNKFKKELELFELAEGLNKTIKNLSKSIAVLNEDGGFSDDVDKLYAERVKLYREFNKRYNEKMKPKRIEKLADLFD